MYVILGIKIKPRLKIHSQMQERTTTGCLMKLGIFLLKYFVHI